MKQPLRLAVLICALTAALSCSALAQEKGPYNVGSGGDAVVIDYGKPIEQLRVGDIIHIDGRPEVIFRINPDGTWISIKEEKAAGVTN